MDRRPLQGGAGARGPGGAPAIRALLRQFGSTDPERRVEAVRDVQAMGRDGVDAILTYLQDEQVRREVGYRVSGIVIILLVGAVAALGGRALQTEEPSPIFLLPLVGVFAALLTLGRFLIPARSEQHARALLACLYETIDTPRALGPLLEAQGEFADAKVNAWNTRALMRVIPACKASDIAALNPKQRGAVNRILLRASGAKTSDEWKAGPEVEADLLVLLMRSLGPIATKETRDALRRLSEMRADTDAQRRVIEAAGEAAAGR